MSESQHNTFFTNEIYETEIGLDVNEDVLNRIYSDNVQPSDQLPIEFFFVTDVETKALSLKSYLSSNFPTYKDLKVQPYQNNYELIGTTHPIAMNIQSINQWNQQLWDIGYEFDCKLDGWQVGV